MKNSDLFAGQRDDIKWAIHETSNKCLRPAFQYNYIVSSVVRSDVLYPTINAQHIPVNTEWYYT